MPITHWTMLIGALAIAGIPPLAGFFSKDEILGEAFKLGFEWVWLIGVVVALMTAFYMFRLMGKTFYGESHVDPAVEPHVHESPRSMTVPLILLAGLSIVAGAILGLPFGDSTISQWLEPVFHPAARGRGRARERPMPSFGIDGVLILVSVAVATIGMVLAWRLFGFFRSRAHLDQVRELTARVPRLYLGSFNKWYFDELNDLLFVRIGGVVANGAAWFDVHVIDGAVNGIASRHAEGGRRDPADPDGPRAELRAGHRRRPHRDRGRPHLPDHPLMISLAGVPILSLIIFAPLVGALILAFVPGHEPARGQGRRAGHGAGRVRVLAALRLLVDASSVEPTAGGFQFQETVVLDPVLRHPVPAWAWTASACCWWSSPRS